MGRGGAVAVANGMGDRDDVRRYGVARNRVRMGQAAVFAGGRRGGIGVEPMRVEAEGAGPHQRPVGLALPHPVADERGAGRLADVEGVGGVPLAIGVQRRHGFVPAPSHDGAGEGQRHLRVVRGLARERSPVPPVGERPETARVVRRDVGGSLELDEAPQAVAGDLPQQASLGPGEQRGVPHRPSLLQPRRAFPGAPRGRVERGMPRTRGDLGRDGERSGKGAQGVGLAVVRVGDLPPRLVQEDAARSSQQSVPCAVVPSPGAVDRGRRRRLAGRHQGQPVRDARHRAIARRARALEVRLRRPVSLARHEDDVGGREGRGEPGVEGAPVPGDGPAPLGPGEEVPVVVRVAEREDDPEDRAALDQEADGDRAPAASDEVVTRPVVRIDEPDRRSGSSRRTPRLLPDVSPIGKRLEEAAPDEALGLDVGVGLVDLAARPVGKMEVVAENRGGRSRGGDGAVEGGAEVQVGDSSPRSGAPEERGRRR